MMPACVLSDVIGDTHLHLEYLQQKNKIGGLGVDDEEISGIYDSYFFEKLILFHDDESQRDEPN